MEALLITGGWLFWIIMIVGFIVISVALYNESGPGATISLLIWFAVLNWLFGLHIPEWIGTHFKDFVLWVMFYIGVGIAWCFVKWYFHVLNKRDDAIESFRYYSNSSATKAQDFQKWMHDHIPQATQNKALIVLWMSYWPFSAAETLLNDPIRRFFLFVFRRIQGLLQSIADRVFANVQELK